MVNMDAAQLPPAGARRHRARLFTGSGRRLRRGSRRTLMLNHSDDLKESVIRTYTIVFDSVRPICRAQGLEPPEGRV